MKVTVKAPSNIAFIKYWGKRDERLRLPLNPSLSMNISEAYTITTVELIDGHSDQVSFLDQHVSDKEMNRVVAHLDLLRAETKQEKYFRVVTKNSMPMSAGLASSASGYAALTTAVVRALGLKLSEREMTVLARIGSGSACRSIPDGFVEWTSGDTSETSYAQSLYPPPYWPLCDVIAIVSDKQKEISTSNGMKYVQTSPFLQSRLNDVVQRFEQVKDALAKRNITLLGECIEAECLNMHAVMMTQTPAVLYWSEATIAVMRAVWTWRREGMPAYFTIDAGPNVHVICDESASHILAKKLPTVTGVSSVLVNSVADGARVLSTHLF